MDHLYLCKTHLNNEKGRVFKYLLNAVLNSTFSFLRFFPLCDEMLKILISALFRRLPRLLSIHHALEYFAQKRRTYRLPLVSTLL